MSVSKIMLDIIFITIIKSKQLYYLFIKMYNMIKYIKFFKFKNTYLYTFFYSHIFQLQIISIPKLVFSVLAVNKKKIIIALYLTILVLKTI